MKSFEPIVWPFVGRKHRRAARRCEKARVGMGDVTDPLGFWKHSLIEPGPYVRMGAKSRLANHAIAKMTPASFFLTACPHHAMERSCARLPACKRCSSDPSNDRRMPQRKRPKSRRPEPEIRLISGSTSRRISESPHGKITASTFFIGAFLWQIRA